MATVERVRFAEADHLGMRAFATRRLDYSRRAGLGSSFRTIAAEGFDPAGRAVTTACRTGGPVVTEMALEVVADAPVARGRTLEVEYRAGRRHGTARVPVTILLCSYSAERCPTS